MPIPDRVRNNPEHRMAPQAQDVLAAIHDSVPDATETDVDVALADVDADEVWDEEAAGWTHEVWDRTSPINGVPAAQVLASRTDIPATGDVILVKQGDRVVMFQPHEPDQPGIVAIPAGQGMARGRAIADRIVSERVSARVAERVREKLER